MIRHLGTELVFKISSQFTFLLAGSKSFFFLLCLQALSGKSAYQRHKQWLQHAKTRSARHKIMKV